MWPVLLSTHPQLITCRLAALFGRLGCHPGSTDGAGPGRDLTFGELGPLPHRTRGLRGERRRRSRLTRDKSCAAAGRMMSRGRPCRSGSSPSKTSFCSHPPLPHSMPPLPLLPADLASVLADQTEDSSTLVALCGIASVVARVAGRRLMSSIALRNHAQIVKFLSSSDSLVSTVNESLGPVPLGLTPDLSTGYAGSTHVPSKCRSTSPEGTT